MTGESKDRKNVIYKKSVVNINLLIKELKKFCEIGQFCKFFALYV